MNYPSNEWEYFLEQEFEKPYFDVLKIFVEAEYSFNECFPPKHQLFNAFDLCPFNKLKVVIIGQDPYHSDNQANGLCFSVNESIPLPQSLINIFRELQDDLGVDYPDSGDLSSWARQGVLLLNSTLSVRRNEPASHQKQGWEKFTNQVIKSISEEFTNIVFLLWGAHAKQKKRLIDLDKHWVLESGHPSPLSANRGYWFGNKHFSQTNALLKSVGKTPIKWGESVQTTKSS